MKNYHVLMFATSACCGMADLFLRRLFFSQIILPEIKTVSFSIEFRCYCPTNKFRTGTLCRVFSYVQNCLLEKLSAITRCPLYRGFQVICVFWNSATQFPPNIFVKVLIQEIRVILDDSLNREVSEEEQKSREVRQIKTFENWKIVYFYFSIKNMGCHYKEGILV